MTTGTMERAPDEPILADIAKFFIEIALADRQGRRLPDTKKDKLKHVLYALTARSAGTPINENYQIDIDHAGYVKCRINDDIWLFLPFHLSAYFPMGEILDELIGVAGSLRLSETNPICISGSATFLGAFNSISDLDFCEYYMNAPVTSVPQSVMRKWIAEIIDVTIIKTRCLSHEYNYPWPEAGLFTEHFFSTLTLEVRPTVKIDGIYVSATFGPLPVSNLALLMDQGVESGSAANTFVFQEAVLVRTEMPPRTLVNPESLGGYLNFLMKAAEDYVSADPLTSLKRSLSFFLLTTRYREAEIIIKFLQSAAAEVMALEKRQAKVEAMLDSIPAAIAARITPMYVSQRLPPEIAVHARVEMRPRAERLAQEMLAIVEDLYAAQA